MEKVTTPIHMLLTFKTVQHSDMNYITKAESSLLDISNESGKREITDKMLLHISLP